MHYRRPPQSGPSENVQPPKGPEADAEGGIIINRQLQGRVIQYQFGANRYTILQDCKNRFGNDLPTFQGRSIWPVGEYRVKWSRRLETNYVLPYNPRGMGERGRADREHVDFERGE